MKDFILTVICTIVLLTCGCRNFMYSHNANQILDGKFTRLGVGDYGLVFGSGLIVTQAVRENTKLTIETTDGNDFNGEPSAKMDGVRRICIQTGPQCTGFLVDLSKEAPDAVGDYVKIMPKLYAPDADEKKKANADAKKEDK